MIQPETFAENTLRLLQQDPRRYLNFGVFWFFVKALLKRYYTRDNLHILGEYMDPECMARMPEFATIQEAMQANAQKSAAKDVASASNTAAWLGAGGSLLGGLMSGIGEANGWSNFWK